MSLRPTQPSASCRGCRERARGRVEWLCWSWPERDLPPVAKGPRGASPAPPAPEGAWRAAQDGPWEPKDYCPCAHDYEGPPGYSRGVIEWLWGMSHYNPDSLLLIVLSSVLGRVAGLPSRLASRGHHIDLSSRRGAVSPSCHRPVAVAGPLFEDTRTGCLCAPRGNDGPRRLSVWGWPLCTEDLSKVHQPEWGFVP